MEQALITRPQHISVGEAATSKADQLQKKIAGLIVEIGQYCGMKIEPTDADTASRFYLRDLETDFADKIDTTEVRKVFYAGVRGQFGEYYGLNAKTFYRWTNAYIKAGMSDRIKRQKQEKAVKFDAQDRQARERRIAEIKAQAPAPEMIIEEVAQKMNINQN